MAAHIIGSIGGTQADSVPIKRALLSVSDKTGLVELGKALAKQLGSGQGSENWTPGSQALKASL